MIHDSIVCYSLWVDAMYFELQNFLPFHCSSSVRTYHKCSNLAICIAIIFRRFYDNNCSSYRFWHKSPVWYLIDIENYQLRLQTFCDFPFAHWRWVVTFTGAIHFSKCSNLPQMYQLPINVVTFVPMHTFGFVWNSGSGVMLSVMRDGWCWNKLCGEVI